MDSDSSEKSVPENPKDPLHSSDSNESYVDAESSPARIDFDELKNDAANSNHSEKDELSTHSNDGNFESGNNNEKSAAENTSISVSRIKLVPIESLLKATNVVQKKDECHAIELSSGSSSDDVLATLVNKKKESSPKKTYTKTRREIQSNRHNYAEISSNDDSDSDIPITAIKQKRFNEKSKSTHSKPRDIHSVKVQLTKLPLNLEPLLKKYDLTEIRDRHQNIIVSRKRTRHNEVHKLNTILVKCFSFTYRQQYELFLERNKIRHLLYV